MLDLLSPRWGELSHAYGEATDIPALLEQAKTAPNTDDWQAEPWYSLWSSLCHQGDVYTASYAAVPHLIVTAATKSLKDRLPFISLVGSIVAKGQHVKSPPIPLDLVGAYEAALDVTATLILECLIGNWTESDYKVLLGGLAAVKGQPALGEAIFWLEREITCPQCDAIFTAAGYDFFSEVDLIRAGISEFTQQQEPYQQWRLQHPLGFVLLIRPDVPLEAVWLHRATCSTLDDSGQGEFIKICAADITSVMTWQVKYGFRSTIQHCATCKPSR